MRKASLCFSLVSSGGPGVKLVFVGIGQIFSVSIVKLWSQCSDVSVKKNVRDNNFWYKKRAVNNFKGGGKGYRWMSDSLIRSWTGQRKY